MNNDQKPPSPSTANAAGASEPRGMNGLERAVVEYDKVTRELRVLVRAAEDLRPIVSSLFADSEIMSQVDLASCARRQGEVDELANHREWELLHIRQTALSAVPYCFHALRERICVLAGRSRGLRDRLFPTEPAVRADSEDQDFVINEPYRLYKPPCSCLKAPDDDFVPPV